MYILQIGSSGSKENSESETGHKPCSLKTYTYTATCINFIYNDYMYSDGIAADANCTVNSSATRNADTIKRPSLRYLSKSKIHVSLNFSHSSIAKDKSFDV